MRIRALLIASALAAPAVAQSPLSAIDWLDDPSPVIAPAVQAVVPGTAEAPVSQNATAPQVAVQPIGTEQGPSSIGLLPSRVTGLPETLWEKSEVSRIKHQFEQLDAHDIPVVQELLYTLLLAESEPPNGTDPEAFLSLRAERLASFGVIEPAAELLSQLPLSSARQFDLYFDLTLYAGLEDKACETLNASRSLTNDYGAYTFCAMRGGDWEQASLLFETATALNLLEPTEKRLLKAFLDPEFAEQAPNLAPPRNITPLEFRLYEATGHALPTAGLSLAFAVSDLRELSGWKSQLEAAERLARVEAVSPNVLLGLYTSRKPSASGGVWERARAVQKLDAALAGNGNPSLNDALLAARKALSEVGLETVLAELYVPELEGMPLTGAAAQAGFELKLLTPAYEEAKAPQNTPRNAFLVSLAKGEPKGAAALNSAMALAIEAGFSAPLTPQPQTPESTNRLTAMLADGQLGEAILIAMSGLVHGQSGDYTALTRAFASLRQMGLEDVSRRAALQMLLLKRGT
ncbi:hypothetical protein KO498_11880 [Lentibacter algarum]|uniref:hypothetical protein n=1 Tax=Lentibacter algarum TaxID=576131 RepID=UPI001C08F5E8|nr:hypothetical protein [Lentibacter algarum]MBU2982510.1 hypothetical protein [Lentibacter algarum]